MGSASVQSASRGINTSCRFSAPPRGLTDFATAADALRCVRQAGPATLASLIGAAAVGSAASAVAKASRRALQPTDAAASAQPPPSDDLWPVWQGFGGALVAEAAQPDPLGALAVPFEPRCGTRRGSSAFVLYRFLA